MFHGIILSIDLYSGSDYHKTNKNNKTDFIQKLLDDLTSVADNSEIYIIILLQTRNNYFYNAVAELNYHNWQIR